MTEETQVTPDTPTTESTPEIPKELLDKVSGVKAVATAYNLLDKGYFPHNSHIAIQNSLSFLKVLHEQALKETLEHPLAHLVDELKVFLDKAKEIKDEQNGQS